MAAVYTIYNDTVQAQPLTLPVLYYTRHCCVIYAVSCDTVCALRIDVILLATPSFLTDNVASQIFHRLNNISYREKSSSIHIVRRSAYGTQSMKSF